MVSRVTAHSLRLVWRMLLFNEHTKNIGIIVEKMKLSVRRCLFNTDERSLQFQHFVTVNKIFTTGESSG